MALALEYFRSAPRYLGARTIGSKVPGLVTAGLAPLRLVTQKDPDPVREGWARVKPHLSGICGSDLSTIAGRSSFYFSPLVSLPFVPGHEVVGELLDDCGDLKAGQRVVISSVLGCAARGEDPPCEHCAAGHVGRCDRVTVGHLKPGLQTGYCSETGGGWSRLMVAHRSQLWPVPNGMGDETAVLIEPLACAIHAARAVAPAAGQTIAVIGAGTIGLLCLAALREAEPAATVLAVAKHAGQAHEARRLGADHTTPPDSFHLEGARVTGARRLVGHQGRELLLGGFDAVLDCVGSGSSIEAAITATRAGGTVVLAGMPGAVTVDLAMAWQREILVRGAYGYRHDFPAALELASRLRPGRLVARGWHLREYRAALEQAPRAARGGRVKTLFDLREAA